MRWTERSCATRQYLKILNFLRKTRGEDANKQKENDGTKRSANKQKENAAAKKGDANKQKENSGAKSGNATPSGKNDVK
jgi:hypothetical protein